jgi:probable O-glycosylation ligase (exosortase A-associated)
MNAQPQVLQRWQQALLGGLVCLALGAAWWVVPDPRLIVVMALLPLAALTALRLPFLLVLMFIVFSFFRLHEVLPWLEPLRLPQLLAVGALGVLAWHVLLSRSIQPYWSRELSWLSGFFLLVSIGVPLASNSGEAISIWTGSYVKIYCMTLATCWLLRRPQDFNLAARLFVLSGLLVACVAISNKLNGIGLVEETRVTIGREIGSVLGDPNDLALVLLFPASFALALALRGGLPRWERTLGLLTFGFVVMAILFTQSRGGLLGLIAVTGVFAWRRVQNKALLLSVGVVALVLLFAAAGISGRSSGGADEAGIDESAMGRLYAWEAAWGMALDHPFRGVGLGNFYFNYYFYSPHWDGLNHAVHSTWFGVLAETGFLGLLVFIGLVISTLRRIWKACSSPELKVAPPILAASMEAATAGLIGFVVSGTFLTQGFTWPLYLQAAIAVASVRWLTEFASQNATASHPGTANPRP